MFRRITQVAIVLIALQAVPALALTEWTMHKTPDGAHPDGNEQQLMWLMNRARTDPAAEGRWLATSTDPDVAFARDWFQVNKSMLIAAFDEIQPRAPAAFDARLYRAAYAHSLEMIRRDAQDHNGQIERVRNFGFDYMRFRGNVFSYATNALNAHAGFNIDWGYGPGGMQDPPGHRMGLMGVDGAYSNVGMAAVAETAAGTEVGELVVTQNFADSREDEINFFNGYVVGTVWQDTNGNAQYDPGEGVPGVTVTPSRGEFYAVTSAGGGYAIPVTTRGIQTIKFSGGGVQPFSTEVAVTAAGNLVDYVVSSATTGGANTGVTGNVSDTNSTTSASPVVKLTLNQVDSTRYGRAWGETRYGSRMVARFDSDGRDLILIATGFDVDTANEMDVRLNGKRLGYFLVTGDGLTRPGNAFSIPASSQKNGVNTLTFVSRDTQWGITNMVLRNVTGPMVNLSSAATAARKIGWKYGEGRHRTVVRARFTAAANRSYILTGKALNPGAAQSVRVLVNGQQRGMLRAGGANRLAALTRLVLPASQLQRGANTVEFQFTGRPGQRWGITQARVIAR